MYKILELKEIENLRKVEKVLEAGKNYGCKIAIVDKNSDSSLKWQASEALMPLAKEESIRVLETTELPNGKILVCFWQGETIYSAREKGYED